MKTEYTIKNFRAFDEKGATVNFKPITILTGTNGSGKSSIVKSLVLFDTYRKSLLLDEENGEWCFSNHRLDFNKSKAKNLGSYQSVLNKSGSENKIEFSFSTYSKLFGDDIRVCFVFEADENDTRKFGTIYSLSFYTKDGNLILFVMNDEKKQICLYHRNFNLLRDSFLRFMSGLNYLSAKDNNEKTEEINNHSFVNIYKKEKISDIEQWREKNSNEWYYFQAFQQTLDYKSRKKSQHIANIFGNVLSSGDGDTYIQKLIKYDVIFYFPILETLFPLSKKEFKTEIEKLLNGKDIQENMNFALQRMMRDFQESEHGTFWEYYKTKEDCFFQEDFDNISDYYDNNLENDKVVISVKPLQTSYLWATRNSWSYKKKIDDPDYTGDDEIINGLVLDRWEKATNNCDFTLVTDVVMNLDLLVVNNEPNSVYDIPEYVHRWKYISGMKHHKISNCFHSFVYELLHEAVKDVLSKRVSYLDSSVLNIKRMYPLDADDEFTRLLNHYFEALSDYRNRWGKHEAAMEGVQRLTAFFLEDWIRKFNLGYGSQIDVDEEGLVATIRLLKNDDEKGRLLAEEGFGVSQLFTIILRVLTAVIEANDMVVRPISHHDGLAFEVFQNQEWEENIALEEPEVHLHPKLQSMLAELFVTAYKLFGVHFIIETHSEYIIRKLQLLVAENKIDHGDISIQYVNAAKDFAENEPIIKNINILKDGMLDGNFGSGFFDEADMLSMFLLTAGGNNHE